MTDTIHSLDSKEAIDNSNSKLTIDDITSFLEDFRVPMVCDLCHGKLDPVRAFVPPERPDQGEQPSVDRSKPALSSFIVHEQPMTKHEYAEFRSTCFTLACQRCGNARRLMVGPLHAWLKANKPERFGDG